MAEIAPKIDAEQSWRIVRQAARASMERGEIFTSTQQHRRYRIVGVEPTRILINRLDANEQEVLTEGEVRRSVEKLNAAHGRSPRRSLLYTVAKEVSLVRLHPALRWSGDGAHIETDSEAPDWTGRECELIVEDYFEMLQMELLGTRYNKAQRRRRLLDQIGRSDGSIEFKRANISAVLVNRGEPYIKGYKPRGNFQRTLAQAVESYLDARPDFFTTPLVLAAIEPAAIPPLRVKRAIDVFDEAPEVRIPDAGAEPWRSRRGRRIDFTLRDAANRRLGELGERFALDLERRRLTEAGRDDLAARVEWIARTCGDGVGYDVLSFDERSEAERWLEVKTTGLPKYHPFLVTDLELRCSQAEPDRFNLYRVFDFRSAPRVYVLPGALSQSCQLDPVLYRAGPSRASANGA